MQSVAARASKAEADATTMLAGLNGAIRIENSTGAKVRDFILDGARARVQPAGDVAIFSFDPLPPGEYAVTVKVLVAAPALAGAALTLVSRYELCGLEYFPALFYGVAAGACGLVALAAWPFCPSRDS
jgi:hypothetical protein